MALDPNFLIIAKYVNSGADLAEQIIIDIRKDRKISDATVIALSRFQEAARAASKMLDTVTEHNKKIN
jgi:hypothetical protein